MSISGISTNSDMTANVSLEDTVSIAVLRKSLGIERQAALLLINAIPQSAPRVDAAVRLGPNIDVMA